MIKRRFAILAVAILASIPAFPAQPRERRENHAPFDVGRYQAYPLVDPRPEDRRDAPLYPLYEDRRERSYQGPRSDRERRRQVPRTERQQQADTDEEDN